MSEVGVGPFRCSKCMAYMNLHTVFENNGQKAKCNLCLFVNDVPAEHFGLTDEMGKRIDGHERLEYQFGTVEYKLPSAFVGGSAVTPAIVFLIEVSSATFINGYFTNVISSI